MSRLVEWPARRERALCRNGDNPGFRCRGRLGTAIYISIAVLAVATPNGALAGEVPRGPHVRVTGIPAGVTLSGGQTSAERAWMVPLRGRDSLKVEVPSVLAGNVDLNVALVGDDGAALAERGVELRVKPVVAAASNSEANATQRKEAAITPSAVEPSGTTAEPEPSAATTPAAGFGGRRDDVALGPHFRITGLPAEVILSGGHTKAERPWVMPLSNGKRAWMVPLWALDSLRIEVPPGLTGNFDLVVALADNVGGVAVERAIALRVHPSVVAARSGREPNAGQRKDVAVATPALPLPGSAAPAAPSRPEPDADQRTDSAVTTATPPSEAAAAPAPSRPEPDADQSTDAAVATATPPSGAAAPPTPSRPEPDADQSMDAAVATATPPSEAAAAPAPSRSEFDAEQRTDGAVTMSALPPSTANPAAPSQPGPDAGQRRDVADTTRTPSISGAAPAAPEAKSAVVERRASEELEQAERLVAHGDRYLAQGNIAIARQYFARAANLGLAIAALKIAETYDPNERARPNVYGVKPDLAEARRWYRRALELDMPEAQARVQRLGTR